MPFKDHPMVTKPKQMVEIEERKKLEIVVVAAEEEPPKISEEALLKWIAKLPRLKHRLQ